MPLASESSQDIVVLASMSSECIVVRGPPGTGKPQVIVNIISNALANDEKVLLVCEKRDALDVVYQRLDKIGLSRYIAPLYDGKERFSLYKKLASILDYKAHSGNATKINQDFNSCSTEIDGIIERQKKIAHALRDERLVGVPINKLYALARPNYRTKLSLNDTVQEVNYRTLPSLLDKIARLQDGCKKFDLPHSPWYYRKDFSDFGLTEKNEIIKIVDNMLDLKDRKIVLADNIENQQTLIASLETLSNSSPAGGLFRKFISGGRERTAREMVKRYIKLPDDLQQIKGVLHGAKLGLQFWNDFNNFLSFLTEDGIKELENEISKRMYDPIYSRLIKIQKTIGEVDEVQAHDRRKSELSNTEKEILHQCISKLAFELDWREELKQEIYIHWIDFIETKYPDLKGEPFEDYQVNRERLSKLLKEHEKIVVDNITCPCGHVRSCIH
ncbi:MAG: AAA domain-containing protein [Nitrososphaeraceae archaeon]